MKRIIWILLISIMMSACTHELCDIPGVVIRVKKQNARLNNMEWKYEVTVCHQDRSHPSNTYHFNTNKLYQVGDTIYIGQIYNQSKDTIQ